MQTTKKLFSAALFTFTSAAALLLTSCTTPGATQNGKDGNLKYGLPVPYHTGYVRSPYTRPAQLVNLNGAQPGEIITCPYTGIDFIVPGLTGKKFQERLKAASARRASAAARTKAQKTQAPSPSAKPATASTPQPLPSVASRETASAQPEPKMITPTEEPLSAEELLAAPAATRSEIPFGSNIPGKPGYVRSPFAAAHQLVDVTGLPVGSEVKCPYSNKIFRVPAP